MLALSFHGSSGFAAEEFLHVCDRHLCCEKSYSTNSTPPMGSDLTMVSVSIVFTYSILRETIDELISDIV